ncbi:MAG: 3-demethylubiquinone-9 3-methyltransferase [Nocardioides sp.]|uniref:hypothetical protein n=1 Tax=Nocardioides sp. TaxID=35761 RepID=UPI002601BF70|nr:hypothetical protein [Nocardioides sp.]MCW2834386.1 3-demethylubiquinone-9 3-methyltransferase [Nocardioides sp.]
MTSRLNPYLNVLDAKARDALEFYQSVFGGDLTIMTFGDMGTEGRFAAQVMHGQLETPDGYTLMVADAPAEMMSVTMGNNISVSLSGGSEDAQWLRAHFAGLAERWPGHAAPRARAVGRRVRDARRQVRHQPARQHRPRPRLGVASVSPGDTDPGVSAASVESLHELGPDATGLVRREQLDAGGFDQLFGGYDAEPADAPSHQGEGLKSFTKQP